MAVESEDVLRTERNWKFSILLRLPLPGISGCSGVLAMYVYVCVCACIGVCVCWKRQLREVYFKFRKLAQYKS